MLKFCGAALVLAAAMPATAATVTYGAVSDYAGATLTETFAGVPASTATQTFVDTIGGVVFSYSDVNVNDYGYGNGTNYAGAYVGVGFASPGYYGLSFGNLQGYFGMLVTAADATNSLTFYDGATAVFTYTVGSSFTGSSFVNFAFGAQKFDTIVFNAGPGTGFESDDHTIAAAVPEPATWTMLLAGFGAVGLGLRRGRRSGLRTVSA